MPRWCRASATGRCSPTAGAAARSTPTGYLDIETFQLDGRIPVWRYACGELRIESRIWMEHGENTTYVGVAPRTPTHP